MTREKALIILNECRLGGFARTLYTKEEYCTARDMAIRALEEHETVTEFADRCRECGAKYGKLLKQEPYEDAISRQAVLDLMRSLTRWCVKSEDRKFENVGLLYDDVMFGIDRLPSVTPIQRWIPVSERLPEVNQRVLVTSYGRVCYAMMISADANNGHPVFKLQDSLNERVVCETTVHNEFTTSRIKAWMPLPKSYKAESEDI